MNIFKSMLFCITICMLTTFPVKSDIKCAEDGYDFSEGLDVYECTDVIYTDWVIEWDDGHKLDMNHNYSCHGALPVSGFIINDDLNLNEFPSAQQQAEDLSKHQLQSDETGCIHYGRSLCNDWTLSTDSGWKNFPGDVDCENKEFCKRRQQEFTYSHEVNGQCHQTRKNIAYTKRRDRYCPSGFKLKNATSSDPSEFCYIPKADECEKTENPVMLYNALKVMPEPGYQSFAKQGVKFNYYYNLSGHHHYKNNFSGGSQYWFHNYGMKVVVSYNFPLKDTAYVVRPNGKREYFWDDGTGFTGTKDAKSSLQAQRDGSGNLTGWLYTSGNDQQEHYDADGNLIEISNTSGISQVLTYVDSQLTAVVDSYGRVLEFTYDENGRISSVIANDSVAYHYEYNPRGLLTKVIYPDQTPTDLTDNPFKVYHYEERNHPAALTGVTDELGNRFSTFEYQSNGRVKRTVHHAAPGVDVNEYLYGYKSAPGSFTLTDPYGTEKSFYYGNTGSGLKKLTRATKQNNFCGGYARKYYNSDGNFNFTMDFNNIRTYYTYNDRNLETQRIKARFKPEEQKTQTDWHPIYRKPIEIRELNKTNQLLKTTQYTYDTDGRVLTMTVTDPETMDSRTTTYTYCSGLDVNNNSCPLVGQIKSIDGPEPGNVDMRTFEYYLDSTTFHTKGDLAKVTDSLGNTTEFLSYDQSGRVLTKKDVNNIITNYEYHPRGWLLSSTTNGLTHTREYNDFGGLVKLTQSDGSFITYSYDMAHRLTGLVDNFGNKINYQLNTAGDVIHVSIKDASGEITYELSHVWNELGQLSAVTDGEGNTTQYSYDADGNLSTVTDPKLLVTTYTYDNLDRLKTTKDARNGIINQTYDALNNLVKINDQRGVETIYESNAFGNLVTQNSPDTGLKTFEYDSSGKITNVTDASGLVSSYSYDAINRLTAITYPDSSSDIIYDYDDEVFGNGRLSSISNQTQDINYIYSDHDHLVGEYHTFDQGISFDIQYLYNSAGQLDSVVYPSGKTLHLSYDAMGRVSNLDLDADILVQSIQYKPFGPVSAYSYGNGIAANVSFDKAYKPTNIEHGSVLSLQYVYDQNGNITEITDLLNPAKNQQFVYNELNMLTQATGAYGVIDYVLDPVGNRLSMSKTVDGVTATESYEYEAQSNRLIQWNDDVIDYTLNGNISQIGLDQTFQYNDLNKLTGLSQNQHPILEFGYNGFAEKVVQYTDGQISDIYLYDHQSQLIAEIEVDTNGQTEIVKEYIYFNGQLLAMVQGASIYYYHNDHNGTPLKMTDQLGGEVWSAEYHPYGAIDIDQSTIENDHRLPGQTDDSNSGIYHNYYRNYHPELGRFIESDPIGLQGGMNTYGYGLASPINNYDQHGLATQGQFTIRPRFDIKLSCQSEGCLDWVIYQKVLVRVKYEVSGHVEVTYGLECWDDCTGEQWEQQFNFNTGFITLRSSIDVPWWCGAIPFTMKHLKFKPKHVKVASASCWAAMGIKAVRAVEKMSRNIFDFLFQDGLGWVNLYFNKGPDLLCEYIRNNHLD